MAQNYYIHRISNGWEVSYPLLDKGYLSIGWSCYIDSDLLKKVENRGEEGFNEFMNDHNDKNRSRWCLWRFLQFKTGDIVVVPLFDKEFVICEISEKPESILTLKGTSIDLSNGKKASVGDDGINGVDIGFIVRVNKLKQIPRTYAEADLVSRMKIRQTNAKIDDLAESVRRALDTDGPINIHERILEAASASLKETINRYITPDDLENAVRWYFMKKGADRVWIPAKNEPNKENGADADVIAEFDDLGIVYYVQVKNYQGETSDWAVSQISEYSKQKQDDRDGITRISWVITTSNSFSDEAIKLSKASNVRLINGDEFVRMILNVGLDNIENVVRKT